MTNWSAQNGIAIANKNSSASLLHVTAWAAGNASYNYGIYNYNASPTLKHVTAIADNQGGLHNIGLRNYSSAPTLRNVVAVGRDGELKNYGMSNYGARQLSIDHSIFEGTCNKTSCEDPSGSINRSIANDPDYELHIFSSRLLGDPDTDGTYRCVAVAIDYGTSLLAANSSCRSGI